MSPCESCHAGCCRSFAVPVTGADILAIERGVKRTFWDFVCRWADSSGRIARNYAPHFFFDDEPQTPFVICLTQSESLFRPGTSKCRFLMECPSDEQHPLGKARCGIYSSRPAACRAFPMKFASSGDLAVIHDVPERGRDDSDPVYDLCPREWETGDLDPLKSVQELVVARYEMTFFMQIASVWNRNPQSWSSFPEFIRLVYANRLQRQPDESAVTLPFPSEQARNGVRAAA